MNLPALPIATTASDTSSTSASQLTQGELPKDFVDLLGKRISQVADTSGKKTLDKVDEEALLNALGEDGPALSRDDLNALLSSFSALNGVGLASGKQNPDVAGAKSGQEKDRVAVTDDAAAMQALLAMLQATDPTAKNPAENISVTAATTGLPVTGLTDAKRQGEAPVSILDNADTGTQSAQASLFNAPVVMDKETGISRDLSRGDKQAHATSADAADDAAKFSLTTLHANVGERNVSESVSASGNNAPQATSSVALAMPAQPSTVGTTTLAPQTTNAQLNAPFGSAQWQDALGQQIIMFSRNGQQTAELRLHPQELGALHISLKIDDNQAQIHLASANSQVRSTLEAALPHLRHLMAENGINLGQSSVGSDTAAWQQAQQQMADKNNGDGNRDASYQQQFGHASEKNGELLNAPEQLKALASSVNGVDIFA
ncbi:flagellar hook-length control protein FliK [Samsonia erythrinae]|uniref:Flagellar hook-length control protein FliK n=1 Tax=Samsonia erythrinae TaxID=160434 RepID=A0A4R3VKX6_9GAMM|nr:flagellar hook-length control protein FliK [Samsonia erythrinae]TCV06904.1 flagellar hook-length control protein FliK [Samsonia erythrinae]